MGARIGDDQAFAGADSHFFRPRAESDLRLLDHAEVTPEVRGDNVLAGFNVVDDEGLAPVAGRVADEGAVQLDLGVDERRMERDGARRLVAEATGASGCVLPDGGSAVFPVSRSTTRSASVCTVFSVLPPSEKEAARVVATSISFTVNRTSFPRNTYSPARR